VDVRIIAATNRVLMDEVKRGAFRGDLYYRLNVFPITVPPLRARPDDVAMLSRHLLDIIGRRHNRRFDAIPAAILAELEAYDWPGNVRELENVLERAVIVSVDGTLRLSEPLIPRPVSFERQPGGLLVDVEREHIRTVLERSRWRIEGARGAARMLGLKPSTLRSRMQRLGIARTS